MLCHACHVHARRDFPYCLHCGTLRRGAKVTDFGAPQLTGAAGAAPFPLTKARTTVGRDPSNDLVVDDPSVSRLHAEIVREPSGFAVRDLNSLNGTSVGSRPLRGAAVALSDGDGLTIGDIAYTFEQPRSVAIGSKTVMVGTQQTLLQALSQEAAPTATEPLSGCPVRRSGWALKRIPDSKGIEKWVLRNVRSGQYLEMSARDRFIWEQIDGEATVRDILFAYVDTYGELALPRIESSLRSFESIGLVRGLSADSSGTRRNVFRRIGHAIFTGLLRLEISIKGVDGVVGRLYRAGAWRFFTRTGVTLLWAMAIAGFIEFLDARHHQKLFAIGGAGLWGALVIAAGYLVALMAHETAHALAVKSYGRTVTRGGFMLMMGMPFAFVDTSDMWLGTRWSRVVVTMSGPLSTAALAGSFAIVAAQVHSPVVAGMAFQLAFGLYMNTLYNCNPLMPLDGYQALADSLRIPKLREEAMAYATHGVWRDVTARHRPRPKQLGLLFYGVAAVGCSYVFLYLGIVSWHSRVGKIVNRHLKPPFNTLLLVAVIGLVMFPVWYRYGKKLSTFARRRAQRRTQASEASAEGAGILV
jgi:putative peptide zinc metalloprotease protein